MDSENFITPFIEKELHKLLLVDDDMHVLQALEQTLVDEGYQVFKTTSGKDALEILENQPIAVLICDQRMPQMNGIDLLKHAIELQPQTIRIMLTGHSTVDMVSQAINQGQISHFIQKPWERVLLVQIVAESVKKYRLQLENQALNSLIRAQNDKLQKNHEGVRKELQLGARIYESLLLGKIPDSLPGFAIDAMTAPSQVIDGDFYDFYHPTKGYFDVVLGDVMGKGLPAALVGTAVKTQLMRFAMPFQHAQVLEKDQAWSNDLLSPQEILNLVHNEIVHQLVTLEYFVTLFYGRFDLRAHNFSYVDCGSAKPIHYHAKDHAFQLLEGDSYPLGTVEADVYKERTVTYGKDDLFIFYSDGVTEAKSPNNELFGVERLLEIIKHHVHADPNVIIKTIKSAVIGFTQKASFDDDLTLIVIKVGVPQFTHPQTYAAARFPAHLSHLKSIREFIMQKCQHLPGDATRITTLLQLAINEAFCNVVKHGYASKDEEMIVVHLDITSEGVLIELSDRGISFDPSLVPHPDSSGEKLQGFGWFIIKEIADRISYVHKETDTGWNHLSIFKKFCTEGKKMQLAHAKKEGVLIITPEVESLDANDTPEFKEKVASLILASGDNHVIIDLHHIQFIDSSGLGTFLSILRSLHSQGGELKLACMNKPIRTLFELVSMHKIFEIYNSIDDAIQSYKFDTKNRVQNT